MKLECSLDDLKVRPSKNEDLRKLFSEFEFSSMLAVLEDESEETSKTTEPLKKMYETVLTEVAFNKWIKKLKKNKIFALDLETTSLRPVQARAVGISFSCNTQDVTTTYISFPMWDL